ncbi:E3 ubiquitin-protein ligase DTX3L1 [Brachyhypopomus gauderio]|uniref:E3 ubiquitin-protein ligase DTX3L1 n=1 Tax=Brachyhypopomus gauderio TaxID=698409 RepID=UPI004041DA23
MGSAQSKDKMHCNRYLNGDGPPPLAEQVQSSINGPRNSKKRSKIVDGNQPSDGQMTMTVHRRSVPGYPKSDTIQIDFVFEDGTQTEKHPNPGQMYCGLHTQAYLPQNSEGRKVYELLKVAFDHKLLFTVTTTNTGEEGVTFSDIPLKTMESGGAKSDCYPDPNYLKTVKKILKSKGID